MLTALFTALLTQGALIGLAVLVLLAAAPRLQKRYGPRWLCRLWLTLGIALLVPVRMLLPAQTAAVQVSAPAALSEPLPILTETVTQAEYSRLDPAISGVTLDADTALVPRAALRASYGHGAWAVHRSAGWWLAAAWLTGAAAVLLWQGTAYLVWRRRTLRTAAKPHESWQAALSRARADTGRTAAPPLLAVPGLKTPMVVGILRPRLLVPAGPAPQGAPYMLAHELTHIARHDVPRKAFFLFVCAVHWYDPAVWLLARRAGRDIEAACDADTLRARPAAYRAAYADALLAAAAQGRAPALTTSFVLNKKQFKQRLAALWDTAPKRRGAGALAVAVIAAVCAGALVACKPADGTVSGAAPAQSTATEESTAEAAQKRNHEVTMTADEQNAAEAAREVGDYWRQKLESDPTYAYVGGMITTVVDPATYEVDDDISAMLDMPLTETATLREYLQQDGAVLCKLYYYVEYQPEIYYLGPQNSDGNCGVCVAHGYGGTGDPLFVGWLPEDGTSAQANVPYLLPEAEALGLSSTQYRILLHQCRALQNAGLTDFATPDDWTDEQLYRYIYCRSGDFKESARQTDWWQTANWANITAINRILTIDFTTESDWPSNYRYLPSDWPGFTDEQLASFNAALPTADTADLDGETQYTIEGDTVTVNGTWTFRRQDDQIIAEYAPDGAAAQRYTFAVFAGQMTSRWDARTYCLGGEALS